MKRKPYDGHPYGRLTILCDIQPRYYSGTPARIVLARCACDGGIQSYRLSTLQSGGAESCGCLQKEAAIRNNKARAVHGCSNTVEHKTWDTMLQRCYNPKNTSWPNYGSRGIEVCKRWHDFENFLADMGPRPSPKHSIERKNNNGHYTPKNCVWATDKQQARNRRTNRAVTFAGQSRCLAEWDETLGFSRGTVGDRLRRGWTAERALTTPVQRKNDMS